MLGGAILDLIAFPRGAEVGSVPPEVIFNLGLAQGPLTSIFTLAGLLLYMTYRLDRRRHSDIVAELEQRRRASGGEESRGRAG